MKFGCAALTLVFLLCGLGGFQVRSAIAAQEDPVDKVINEWMKTIKATAASVTVTKDGKTVIDKRYGFLDTRKKRPTDKNTVFRIGSCTKPIVAIAILNLSAAGKVSLNDKIYELLDIKPIDGELGDERLKDITLQHLLDHKGGWDSTRAIDPLYELQTIRSKLKLKRDPKKQEIVKFMWAQPLQDSPGRTRLYSNFGYLLLGLAIEKTTGHNLERSIQELVCEPLGIDSIGLSHYRRRRRPTREVHYPTDSKLSMRIHDAAAGLTGTSPALCKIMNAYWLDGQVRKAGNNDYFFFQTGSLPDTTSAVMEQRLDGIHFAVLFNSRRNKTYDDDNSMIRDQLNRAIDEVLGDQ